MTVTEFTYKDAKDLIATPKIILEMTVKQYVHPNRLTAAQDYVKTLHYVLRTRNSSFFGLSIEAQRI